MNKKPVRVSTYLAPEMYRRFENLCAETPGDPPISYMVRVAIQQWIDSNKSSDGVQ